MGNCYGSNSPVINDTINRDNNRQITTPPTMRPQREKRANSIKYGGECKICILGQSSVGKSLFYKKLIDDGENYLDKPTTAAGDNSVKYIKVENYGRVTTAIWDTAGQESYATVTGQIIKKSDGILLMYSIDDRPSFDMIKDFWIRIIEKYCKNNVRIFLIGNKNDLVQKGVERDTNLYVTEEEGKALAESNQWLFGESSAKLNTNVNSSVQKLIENVLNERNNENGV